MLVPGTGLEPISPGSEPGILPLDDPGNGWGHGTRTRTILLPKQACFHYTNPQWGARGDLNPILEGHNLPCYLYTTLTPTAGTPFI